MKILGELALVRLIERMFNTAGGANLGIGDDCAAIAPSKGTLTLVTTDSLVDGVHFNKKLAPAELIGAKTASVNLSDIASMGGVPKYLLLSANITPGTDAKWMTRFLRGFKSAISPFKCQLVGGNVSSANNDLSFTVTAIGEIERRRMVKRDGARPGDVVYVTGTPGDSALGLDFLLGGGKRLSPAQRKLVARHLNPTPRVEWGRLIAKHGLATAMIDISDGVALDLYRVMEASGTSAAIDLYDFPLSKEAAGLVKAGGAEAWRRVLTGGEDYELMFTVAPGKTSALERLVNAGKIIAAPIGVVTEGKPDVKVVGTEGRIMKMGRMGWTHG
ncbi:MAG: thiamine-phosphate kinase [Nitrospinae bacterium]|nr:thiamine-phosphate kinase [Nitrospinota bacterium]